MSEQKLLPFDDLDWSWEAKWPIFGWLPGDVDGYVWHPTREAVSATANKPLVGRPFYGRMRIVCRRVDE